MGNFYNIKTKYEDAIYERGEDNYYIVKIKNIDADNYVDPFAVSISITGPCSSICTLDAAMTSECTGAETGIYYYSHDIPSDATYGEYEIIVTATSPTDIYCAIARTTKYKDKFYVLPWNIAYDVRRYAGITEEKSVSSHDIAGIIWEAYLEVLKLVYIYHWDESVLCNPDTGAGFDGTNTVFATRHGPIADRNGDGQVTGYGEQSCGTDIDGWWTDDDGNCHLLKITVNEPHCGNITITQLNGDPIPGSACCNVRVNYSTEWRTFSKALLKSAVAYLAAHKCIVRFRELGRATLADLHSNKEVILNERDRMEKEYKKVLRKISRPVIGGGMLPGES